MTTIATLVPVTLDGLVLNVAEDANGFGKIVTDLVGWYDTPEPDPHDVNRSLADGGLYGPMVLRPRELTIAGTVYGPRASVVAARDALAAKAVKRVPFALTVVDPWLNQALVMTVRASGPMAHTWIGHETFRYQIVLRANDPRRYASAVQTATITLSGAAGGGRKYPRKYPWVYGSGSSTPGVATLTNQGNVAAPVIATYNGQLAETRLTDQATGNFIRVAALNAGETIYVATDTLVAQAAGGASRANYLLAGTTPLLIPPQSTVTWRLIGSGNGNVVLQWRSAWS